MEMHQIKYFLTVSETLNFTRAAEQCHVAQPSLTRAIKKLEGELGGDLFHREGRRTHLTDLGQMMQPLLSQSLESAAAAKEQAQSYGKAEIAHLRMGLSNTVAIRILEPVVTEMLRVLPDLELMLSRGTAEDIEKSLENGQIDVAITARDKNEWERIQQWRLFSEEFVVGLNPNNALSGKSALKLGDFENQNILSRAHCEGAGGFSELLYQHNISATFTHEVNQDSDLEFLLNNNLGVGLVPRSVAFDDPTIVRLPITDADYCRSLYLLAVVGRKYSEPVDLFIRLLRARDWSPDDS